MSKPAIMRQVWDRRFGLRVQSFSVSSNLSKIGRGCWPIFQSVTIKAIIIRIASTFGNGQFRWMW